MCQRQATVKGIFKLYLQVWFYSVLFGFVTYLIGSEPWGLLSFVKMVFPFMFNQYWYFTMYLIVYALSPFINTIIKEISRDQFITLIFVCLAIFTLIPTLTNQNLLFDGEDQLGTFILIYLIGAYIKIFSVKIPRNKEVLFLIVCLTLDIASVIGMRILLNVLGSSKDAVAYFLWPTSKILPIFTGISFFLLFKDFRINRKWRWCRMIEFLSSSVFGVYLFHIGRLQVPLFQRLFDNSKTFYTPFFFPQMLIAMVSIFICGILIDKARIFLFEKPLMYSPVLNMSY